ncbi:hypothetical protein AB0D04_05920 [Streptomyces sp. NPDC048483]|uniref:hypothetical protein n=1 Tax=Streptomyces sp. NPDC048483 TaxID=3154927 RepID=UPI00342C804A
MAALRERLGAVDHGVSTASAQACGRIAHLDRDGVRRSFGTKAISPLMPAEHLALCISPGGSFPLFPGVAAAKTAVGTLAVALANGAAYVLARSLALELAPSRVSATSPGVPYAGARDALGESMAKRTTSPIWAPGVRPGASVPPTTSPTPARWP